MAILGYRNPSSVARMVYEHKLIPAMQIGGKRGNYLFHRADVEAAAATRHIGEVVA